MSMSKIIYLNRFSKQRDAWIQQVLADPTMTNDERRVAMALWSDFSRPTLPEQSENSYREIGTRCQMSAMFVSLSLDRLENAGHLEIKRRFNPDGTRASRVVAPMPV
jgi:DNA-binding MarR family transcriptional regulator